jgi:hypothetical protein
MLRSFRRLAAAGALLAAAVTLPRAAAAQLTLDFENVPTFANQGNTGPLPSLLGFQFFNLRVMSTAETFGRGTNASSGTRFAYAGPGSAAMYRTDETFEFVSAFLSFRAYDQNLAPAPLVVRGYGAGPDPIFERLVTLTNTAQLFTFNWRGVEEVEFDATALQAGRSSVLAIDDVQTVVPEPASVALVASGAVLLGAWSTRRPRPRA